MYAALNCFNAGELSPRLQGRSDVSQYSHGCQTLKNFLVTPYGSVERRPGTKFVAVTGGTAGCGGAARVVRFAVSSTVSYVLEFGDNLLCVYRDNAEVCQIATGYEAADVAKLQFVQSADVMTIVHPDYPVMELKRIGESSFTLTEKAWEYPPVLDPNTDDSKTLAVAISGSTAVPVAGDTVAITAKTSGSASTDFFGSGSVGKYYEIVHVRENNEISRDFTADGTSGTLEVFGYWTFTTHGTWTGVVTIQRSFDGGLTWQDYRTYSSSNDSNTSTSGTEEDEGALYRVKMSDYEQSETGTLRLCRILLVNPDFTVTGVLKVTSVTDAAHATGLCIRRFGGTGDSAEWNEGAFSGEKGYPCTVAYFEERMFFGGTKTCPQRIWASKTGDWDNYLIGGNDDSGLDFTLSSDTINTICWLCQHDELIIGTLDSEWTCGSSDSESALTGSNFRIKRQSVFGSAELQACMVGDVVLFVQRGGNKVREFVYTWEKGGYSSPDMTILADHIAKAGIVATALQQLPDTILWCVLGDGTVAALTYERDQEVVGWHRHVTDGEIKSVCVIPDGDTDKVYFVVYRNGKHLIEQLADRDEDWYVDSGVTISGGTAGTKTVSGLTHLNGKTCQIYADGAVQTAVKITGGTAALEESALTGCVGLEFDSLLSPMPIEVELQNGHSILRKKTIGELRIRVYDSVGGEAHAGSGPWQKIISRSVLSDRMDTGIAEKSEVVKLKTSGGFEEATTIEVRQTDPLPLNVTSIVATYAVAEK